MAKIPNKKKPSWEEYLQILGERANKYGFEVVYSVNEGSNSWITFDRRTKGEIRIHSRLSVENQVYDLIHELGHLCQQSKTTYYEAHFGSVFELFSKGSLVYRMKIIEEEVDAWRLGLILARRLGIKIDKKNFERRKASRLNSYVRWSMRASKKDDALSE